MKQIKRWFRYIIHNVTMNDLKEDLEKDRIDFSKYRTELTAGQVFYRFIDKGDDPFRPTGRKSRFVSEPDNFSFEEYREAYYKNEFERMPILGTGGAAMTYSFPTAIKEVSEPFNKDWWELTLNKNLPVVDIEALCQDKHIPFYAAKERHEAYQLLYGKHLNALLFPSSKKNQYPATPSGEYNLYIYTDWFHEYKKFFVAKKIEGNLREHFIKLYLPGNFSTYPTSLSSINLL